MKDELRDFSKAELETHLKEEEEEDDDEEEDEEDTEEEEEEVIQTHIQLPAETAQSPSMR